MSYARFSDDSSVYVFMCVSGYLECCGCSLTDGFGESFRAQDTMTMLAHLNDHDEAGHKVPSYAVRRLLAERAENDAWMREEAALTPTEGTQDAD